MKRVALALALVLAGCAKEPATGGAGLTKRLVFRMTVDGEIRGTQGGQLPYVYIVALRLSADDNPTTEGPIPIVVPGGNGFVAGNATHYVLWNPLDSPSYTIFRFTDSTLQQSRAVGVPVNFLDPGANGDTLQFEIDMSQLVPADQVDTIRTIQANFLTMNNRDPVGGANRLWDALGDSDNPATVNEFFQFQLRQSRTFTNQNTGNREPVGDVRDPALDISNWSIEVRLIE